MSANPERITLIDGDSIAYSCGCRSEAIDTIEEAMRHVDATMRTIRVMTRADRMMGWIERYDGSKSNFRRHVAASRPYKAGRTLSEDMVWLTECRSRLSATHGFHVVDFIESEDAVAIEHARLVAEGNRVVIATIDKDLRQIAGEFYDYRTGDLYSVSPLQASRNFWTQMVVGDQCDTIPGIPGRGARSKCVREIAEMTSPWSIIRRVIHEYASRGLPYGYFVEQGRLLYILRAEGDVWAPPIFREEYDALAEARA